MPFRSIVRELIEMRESMGNNMSRRGAEAKHIHRHGKSHIAPEWSSPPSSSSSSSSSTIVTEQSHWANLPLELLLDIIQRVEASETSWLLILAPLLKWKEKSHIGRKWELLLP